MPKSNKAATSATTRLPTPPPGLPIPTPTLSPSGFPIGDGAPGLPEVDGPRLLTPHLTPWEMDLQSGYLTYLTGDRVRERPTLKDLYPKPTGLLIGGPRWPTLEELYNAPEVPRVALSAPQVVPTRFSQRRLPIPRNLKDSYLRADLRSETTTAPPDLITPEKAIEKLRKRGLVV